MSAINNLKGHIVKDGKVIYYEKLQNDLNFCVILKYEPFYDGKNSNYHQNSSQLTVETLISTGERQTYSNGVSGITEAKFIETADEKGKFEPLQELTTKDGFRVWAQEYNFGEITIEGKTRKTRVVIWLVEVPKLELLKFCKID